MSTALAIVGGWLISLVVIVGSLWLGRRDRYRVIRKGSNVIVPFTRYSPPYGEKSAVYITVSEDISPQASAILAAGFQFEVELLRTGDVSLTITDPGRGDVDIRVVPNGPEVPHAVADMIRDFIFPAGRMIQ